MNTTIFFDMDGTIADFYGVEGWLDYLKEGNTFPYQFAKPLVRMASLARILNRLQREGYRIGIISWLSKSGGVEYNAEVTAVKLAWLRKHLASVQFDEINIVNYGVPKQLFARTENDIIFDDEEKNRENWTGQAYDVDAILEILKGI